MTSSRHDDVHSSPHELQRKLSNRHLQLIAIGGAIGTGLFMGSGKTIALAGPSILFIYMIIGLMFFFLMRALGEILLSNLHYKSFIDMAHELIGPGAGYYIGWSYWLGWILVGIADLAAIINYLGFWLPPDTTFTPMGQALISVGCVLFVLGLNLLTVKLFGEIEFWFALIKILAILGLIGIGGYMVFNQFAAPDGTTASFQHVWSHGGMFPQGGNGFLAGFQIALFAFVGVELLGTMAAETKDPEKNLPKAVNAIPTRIILFYVLSLFVVMSVTPWNQIPADRSPFVSLFFTCRYSHLCDYYESGGVIFGDVFHEQRCVFDQPHAVWPSAWPAGATGVGDLVKTGSTGQRSAVLLSVYYGRCSLAVFCAEYR